MKLSNFYDKNPEHRPQKTQFVSFNNEIKEAELAAKIADLESKMSVFQPLAMEKEDLEVKLRDNKETLERIHKENLEKEVQMVKLEAQVQEKERLLGEMAAFKQQNSSLTIDNQEMTKAMSLFRFDYEQVHSDLDRYRLNNNHLEIENKSYYTDLLNKEDLIKQLSNAATTLQEEHRKLVESTQTLTDDYKKTSDQKQFLSERSEELTKQVKKLEDGREARENEFQSDKQKYGDSLVQQKQAHNQKRINKLQQDVEDLNKLTGLLKNELSKPQHMSVGSIARQENFKLPLASSAINYRSNNLGTDQPTLLKFSSREVANDH